MLRCGKHAGRRFGDVAAVDSSYCSWVLREKADGKQLSRDLESFARFILKEHGGVLQVGKHRLRFFNEVLRNDPDYARWAASLKSPSKLMIDFQRYVKVQRKRTREPGDDICSICMDNIIDSALIPCGHACACIVCARMLRGACPIFREPISDVLHTFLAGANAGST